MNQQLAVYPALASILGFPDNFDGRYVRAMIDDPAHADSVVRYSFCDLWWPGSGIMVRAGPWIGDDDCEFSVGYQGESVVPVRLLRETCPRRVFDKIRFFGVVTPHQRERASYILFDVVDGARYFALKKPVVVRANLTAFALELLVSPASEPSRTTRESFVPYGLETYNRIQQPSCYALLMGSVLQAATRVNEATGARFEWALVRTRFGEVDVVARPDTIRFGRLEPGATLQALAVWMTGLLPYTLGSPPRSL